MKYLIILLLLFITACTNSPVIDPERTKAKAEMDQVKSLDSINVTLKRIANALEKK